MNKISLILVLILYVSVSLFGVVVGNHLEVAYNNEEATTQSVDENIKILIINGGGHFLESHAGFQAFLSKVELAELTGANFDELRSLLAGTMTALDSARSAYYDLKTLAAATPYNAAVIDQLKTFAYSEFCQQNGLNPVIFANVEAMLSRGNVTGVFVDLYTKVDQASQLLGAVKQDMDKDIFPDIDTLWQINQLYFDGYLAGQYAAMVAATLK